MVDNSFLPVRYHVEIYLRSFGGELIYWAKAKSPFPVPHVGQHIDGRGFEGTSISLQHLQVVDVEHIFWTIAESHVSHKIMVLVVEKQND